jgi:N-acetyl-anhydromuramyl-L-alanine amidase AmpD
MKYLNYCFGLIILLTHTQAMQSADEGSAQKGPSTLKIDTSVVSENFRSRAGKKPEVLILHCVGLSDEWVFQNYGKSSTNGGLGVSAHYYIPQNGNIFQLVSEDQSAFHAGVSDWRSLCQQHGLKGLNDVSIGIEFQALGYAQRSGIEGYFPYSFTPFQTGQLESGISLCQQIVKQHNIARENVVWHSDITPLRKTDPGPLFDAKLFAQNGIGVWPSSDRLEDKSLSTSLEDIQGTLKEWGYPNVDKTGQFDQATKFVLQSHYIHYLPNAIKWDNFAEQKEGASVFDGVKDWNEFPYDKDVLAIYLQNLTKKHFAFS